MNTFKSLLYFSVLLSLFINGAYGATYKFKRCVIRPSYVLNGTKFFLDEINNCVPGENNFSRPFKYGNLVGPFHGLNYNVTYDHAGSYNFHYSSDDRIKLDLRWVSQVQGGNTGIVRLSAVGAFESKGKWNLSPMYSGEINPQNNVANVQADALALNLYVPPNVTMSDYPLAETWVEYNLFTSTKSSSGSDGVSALVDLYYERVNNQLHLSIAPSNIEMVCANDKKCTGESKLVLNMTDGPAPVACGVDGFRRGDLRLSFVAGGVTTEMDPGGAPIQFDYANLPEKMEFEVLNAQPGTSRLERVNLTCSIV